MKKKMGNSCLTMVLSVEEKENISELQMRPLQGRGLLAQDVQVSPPMSELSLCANRASSGNSQDIPPYSCESFSDHACESPICYAKGLYFYQEEYIISRPKMSMIRIHSRKMLLRRVHFTHMKMLPNEGAHTKRRANDGETTTQVS